VQLVNGARSVIRLVRAAKPIPVGSPRRSPAFSRHRRPAPEVDVNVHRPAGVRFRDRTARSASSRGRAERAGALIAAHWSVVAPDALQGTCGNAGAVGAAPTCSKSRPTGLTDQPTTASFPAPVWQLFSSYLAFQLTGLGGGQHSAHERVLYGA
jgi:hypothetical protein